MMTTTTGRLYVVATPIGNLGDFSARGREILAAADCIAAEDTRHSGKLLAHFGIKRPLLAYHDHSAPGVRDKLLRMLRQGANIALVADAGTPLISDPGYDLVKAAREQGGEVIPVPGPSAVTAALSVSGLPTDNFRFAGFPPASAAARRKRFEELRSGAATLVLYESSHRLLDCVDDLNAVFGPDRRIFIAREMTKRFEGHFSGTLEEAAEWLRGDENRRRGEFVFVLAGHAPKSPEAERLSEALRIAKLLQPELPLRKAAALAEKITGVRKNRIYQRALAQQTAD
ncbi:MAG: 16S rRNA (cytidine(1402)-2'-O)-methyltransferase [Gammaproteobacteria bacterium]|nr:16S rRNA (cytidine(1402)-2'-O)-methyltransferase [Gammaproteobacteria bacterium]